MRTLLLLTLFAALAVRARAAEPRGRDLGIPFDFSSPGRANAITEQPASGH